jgi:peptidoglycan/xylan/chitin deacetylase (PgdA/CDA1 family)
MRRASPNVSRSFRSLVLCYHAVSDNWPAMFAVPADRIERQLWSLLRRGYRPVRALDVRTGRRRFLHVTFDDAYANVLEALPALERARAPATVFACSSYADDGRPLDVPELRDVAATFPECMSTMNWDMLRELAERGIEIGSHTVSHPHLRDLSDDELDRELRESRLRIEEKLGRPCGVLAYPYGESDARVREAARRAGYAAAFGLRAPARPLDPYALPRVDLYHKDTTLRATIKTSFLRRPVIAIADRIRQQVA